MNSIFNESKQLKYSGTSQRTGSLGLYSNNLYKLRFIRKLDVIVE